MITDNTYKPSEAAEIDPSFFRRGVRETSSSGPNYSALQKKCFCVMTSVGSKQLLLCIKLKSLGGR